MAPLDDRANQDFQVNLVVKVQWDCPEGQGVLVSQELVVLKVTEEMEDCQDFPEDQESLHHLGHLENEASQVYQD